MDNRGAVSIGLSQFILTLIVGAIVTWIVWLVTEPILSRARTTTNNSTANQATTWLSDGIGYIPVAILLISAMGLVVLAVFRREVMG